MNRIDRLHAILTHLQSKKRVTAEEIADRFGISLRTVYRDVKALEESGIPVIGEAGIGYSVMEGYRLPPVMFTREEAGALLLGSKLAEQFTDHSVRRHFDTALYKIKAVIRSVDKDYVEDLTAHIEILRNRVITDELSQQYLATLQQTMVQKKVVRLVYNSNYKDETTERDLEPIGLCHYGEGWHLIAWCRMRNDYRDFRLGRIKKLQVKEEVFDDTVHPSIQQYVKEMTAKSELQEVVVIFQKNVKRYLREQKYYYGVVSEEDLGDRIRMKFLVSHPLMLLRWLLMFTDAVCIESPDSAKTRMQEMVTELAGHYLP